MRVICLCLLMLTTLPGCGNLLSREWFGGGFLGDNGLDVHQRTDVLIVMGQTLEKQGDLEGARKAFRQALKQSPHDSRAYLRLAVLLDKEGDFEGSRSLYQHALEIDPGNPQTFADQGYSLYLQEEWDAAEMSLRQTLELAPENRRARNNLGLVLARTGHVPEALAAFRQGGCTETEALSNAAFARFLADRPDEARQLYEQALAVDSSSEVAARGLKLVNDHSIALQLQQPGAAGSGNSVGVASLEQAEQDAGTVALAESSVDPRELPLTIEEGDDRQRGRTEDDDENAWENE